LRSHVDRINRACHLRPRTIQRVQQVFERSTVRNLNVTIEAARMSAPAKLDDLKEVSARHVEGSFRSRLTARGTSKVRH
jgi:hypothetical protein